MGSGITENSIWQNYAPNFRKIAAELDNLGDTSTLADPSVVDNLIANRIQP